MNWKEGGGRGLRRSRRSPRATCTGTHGSFNRQAKGPCSRRFALQRVRVETDEEITGIGKSSTTHSSHNFAAQRTGSVRRFCALVFVGLEMALLDAIGKAAQRPVHQLLGGESQKP